MPKLLVTGTMLSCTMGIAPTVFIAQGLPGTPMILGSLPAGTILEFMVANIPTFGMCQSLANPQVAAATAAAFGVLTPMACIPTVVAPWAPPSACLAANGIPFATVDSKCNCAFGGMISVQTPMAGPEDAS